MKASWREWVKCTCGGIVGSNPEVCVLWSNVSYQLCMSLLRLYYRTTTTYLVYIQNLILFNQASTVFWEPRV